MRSILNSAFTSVPTSQTLPAMEAVPLPQLAPETVARVTEFHVEDADATRLKAMGICVGRQLQLIRAGDPLILRVLGARVGLSARLAAGIEVEAIPDSTA